MRARVLSPRLCCVSRAPFWREEEGRARIDTILEKGVPFIDSPLSSPTSNFCLRLCVCVPSTYRTIVVLRGKNLHHESFWPMTPTALRTPHESARIVVRSRTLVQQSLICFFQVRLSPDQTPNASPSSPGTSCSSVRVCVLGYFSFMVHKLGSSTPFHFWPLHFAAPPPTTLPVKMEILCSPLPNPEEPTPPPLSDIIQRGSVCVCVCFSKLAHQEGEEEDVLLPFSSLTLSVCVHTVPFSTPHLHSPHCVELFILLAAFSPAKKSH